ncbi:MAG: MFS transporter [Victivallales bacterium]
MDLAISGNDRLRLLHAVHPALSAGTLSHCGQPAPGFYVSLFYLAGITSLCIATTVWGMLADRFGRKLMLLRASYGAALLYPLLVFAPNFQVMLLIRFLCSFFSGTVNPAQTLLVCTTPPEKHGFVLGTVSTALWSGNMVGYLTGGMIVHYFGYRTAFLSCGVIYLASGLLVHLFVKDNFRRLTVKKEQKREKHSFRELMSPAVLWLLIMFLLMGVARRIEEPFLAMQVELVNGIGSAAFYTGITSAAAALGGIFSGIIMGHLCDRILPRRLALPVLLVSGSATLAQALSGNIQTLIFARFLAYLAAGGLQADFPGHAGKDHGTGAARHIFRLVRQFQHRRRHHQFPSERRHRRLYRNPRHFHHRRPSSFSMIPLMFPTVRASKAEYVCDPDATGRDLEKA